MPAARDGQKHFNQQFKDPKPEKATGHDNVTLKELILVDEAVKPGMKSIIRKSITDKKFPSDYKVARMKTIFKGNLQSKIKLSSNERA